MAENRSIKYDADGDILEIFLAENRPCVSFDLDDDIIVRIDPDSDELVSFSIIGFLNHIADQEYPSHLSEGVGHRRVTHREPYQAVSQVPLGGLFFIPELFLAGIVPPGRYSILSRLTPRSALSALPGRGPFYLRGVELV